MTLLVCSTIILVVVSALIFAIKYFEHYEVKHCLRCPLAEKCDEIDYSAFAEDMKKDLEKKDVRKLEKKL